MSKQQQQLVKPESTKQSTSSQFRFQSQNYLSSSIRDKSFTDIKPYNSNNTLGPRLYNNSEYEQNPEKNEDIDTTLKQESLLPNSTSNTSISLDFPVYNQQMLKDVVNESSGEPKNLLDEPAMFFKRSSNTSVRKVVKPKLGRDDNLFQTKEVDVNQNLQTLTENNFFTEKLLEGIKRFSNLALNNSTETDLDLEIGNIIEDFSNTVTLRNPYISFSEELDQLFGPPLSESTKKFNDNLSQDIDHKLLDTEARKCADVKITNLLNIAEDKQIIVSKVIDSIGNNSNIRLKGILENQQLYKETLDSEVKLLKSLNSSYDPYHELEKSIGQAETQLRKLLQDESTKYIGYISEGLPGGMWTKSLSSFYKNTFNLYKSSFKEFKKIINKIDAKKSTSGIVEKVEVSITETDKSKIYELKSKNLSEPISQIIIDNEANDEYYEEYVNPSTKYLIRTTGGNITIKMKSLLNNNPELYLMFNYLEGAFSKYKDILSKSQQESLSIFFYGAKKGEGISCSEVENPEQYTASCKAVDQFNSNSNKQYIIKTSSDCYVPRYDHQIEAIDILSKTLNNDPELLKRVTDRIERLLRDKVLDRENITKLLKGIYDKEKLNNLDIEKIISENKIADHFTDYKFDPLKLCQMLQDFAKDMREVSFKDEDTIKLLKLDNIIYDNDLLNHPKLLNDLFLKYKNYDFANKYNSGELLQRMNNLSPEIIEIAINDNDYSLLLGGLMSLENLS